MAKSNVTERANPVQEFRDFLGKFEAQIARALPRHLTPSRVMSMAVQVVHRTPALQGCSKISLLSSVIQAAELGLELSGPLGQAYLIPYGKEATLQVSFRGIIQLAFRSKQVEFYNGATVRKGDQFHYERGTDQLLRHMEKPYEETDEVPPQVDGRPPDVTHAYSCIRLKGGGKDFEVWQWQRIEAHRIRFSKVAWDSKYCFWRLYWPQMAVKTMIKQLGKRVPLSTEMANVIDLDDMSESGRAQGLAYKYGLNELAAGPARSDILAASLGAPVDIPEAGAPLVDMPGAPADASSEELFGVTNE